MKHLHLFRFFTILYVRKHFLSPRETGKYLGVHEAQIRDLIKERDIPYYEPFETVYLLKITEIDQWVSRSRVSTKSEIDQEKRKKSYSVFS